MGLGASRLNTVIQEHHDLVDYTEDDLKPDIFSAPNIQVFCSLRVNTKCFNTFSAVINNFISNIAVNLSHKYAIIINNYEIIFNIIWIGVRLY